jgi:hypothetical protein
MRLLLVMVFLLSLILGNQEVGAKKVSKPVPVSAFSQYPLKGTVNSNLLISKFGNKSVRYRVNSAYQLVCKARFVILDYPPRFLGLNSQGDVLTSSTSVFTNYVFDAIAITSPSPKSNNYVSTDLICGDYRTFYFKWLADTTPAQYQFIGSFNAISRLRYEVKTDNYGNTNSKWCSSFIVGIQGQKEYNKAVFSIYDRNIAYYWSSYPINCTSDWKEVQKWIRQGWVYIS